jgi:hypothetical protein
VPKELPKKQAEYFASATVAFQSGQTLAALFLLRVLIEQYWRSVKVVSESIKEGGKTTGEAMGESYKGTLPEDFKARFPSLSEVYGDLSLAIHTANADAALFQGTAQKVVEHFDARRLFKLDTDAPPTAK